MAIGKQLSDNNPSGTAVGQSATDLVSFYGATPIVQPTSANEAVVVTTAITTLVTTPTATDIATAVNSVISRQASTVTLVNQLRADLVNLGLIKGS